MAANTPKAMSSRLATMKFMQRSAAKSTASSPSTPKGPPSKRARLSNGTSAPGAPGTHDDYEILQSALVAEEKKRQDALDKAAQHTGETKWVLSFKDAADDRHDKSMRIRQVGFAEIDAGDDEEDEDEESRPIRMSFGGGIKRKNNSNTPVKTERSEGETTDSENYDSDDPTAALIRETKREVAAERRKSPQEDTSSGYRSAKGPSRQIHEDENLAGLSSLSGGRRLPTRDMSNVECYKCGRKGHTKDRCPNASAGRGRPRGKARR